MLVTRKAVVGFILLAVIVFPFAYLLWTPPVFVSTGNIEPIKIQEYRDNSINKNLIYRPPMIRFNSPIEMAVAITLILELFVFLCYLGLKRIEPYIIAWEENERNWVTNKTK